MSRIITVECPRCFGRGIYTPWDGVCFKCGGSGKVWGKEWTAEERAKLDRANEKRNAKKEAIRQAKLEANKKENMEKYPWLAEIDADTLRGLPLELYYGAIGGGRVLSPRQADVIKNHY